MKKLTYKYLVVAGMTLVFWVGGVMASAQEPAPDMPQPGNPEATGAATDGNALPQISAMDVDNRTVVLNHPGRISVVLVTSEDSQNAARAAGNAMHIFQGRKDFKLIVVVDLLDSLANWAPAIAVEQMHANLDKEAIELKPFYLKNGNKSDPRQNAEVVADFKGETSAQLGWPKASEDLHAVIFGADGLEIKRWDKVEDMDMLQAEVRAALMARGGARHSHQDDAAPSDGMSAPVSNTTP